MRFFPTLFLLGGSLSLFAQQTPPSQGVTLPVEIIPSQPASNLIDPKKVVLQVGDIKITAQQLDYLIDVYPANTQVYLRGPGKQQFADSVVRMLVLAEEARKRKMNETEKFKEQIRFSEANLLAGQLGVLIPAELKVDDVMLRQYFDEHRCEYQTWRARQIVVRSTGSPLPLKPGSKELSDADALAQAQELRKRLAGGAEFAELARTESDDIITGLNGGDIGQAHHGMVSPSVEDALCNLNTGDLSQPVRSQLGYHLLKLESKDAKALSDVKAEVEQRLRPEAAKKAVDDLIAKVKVIKDPEYYSAEPPPAAPSPAKNQ